MDYLSPQKLSWLHIKENNANSKMLIKHLGPASHWADSQLWHLASATLGALSEYSPAYMPFSLGTF